MASSSIDSLLQITGPSRAPVEMARSATSAAKPFEELFSRAAQSAVPRDPSRPESAMSPQDDPPVPEQRDADNNSSLPDDSRLHVNSDEADQAKPAKAASPDESEDEQLQAEDDVVEISGAAASQAPSARLSEEEPPLTSAEQSSDGKSPAENATEAAAGEQAADSAAGQPNGRTGNRRNQPDPSGTSQPVTPELTAETVTNTEGKPAAPASEAATVGTQVGTPRSTTQDAPAEFAAQDTASPNRADLPPTEDLPPESQATTRQGSKPTERSGSIGADAGISDKPPAKDRQTAGTPSPSPDTDRAAAAPKATHNADPASPTSPTHVAEMATPVSTESAASSGIADRALDRMTSARSVQPARQSSEPPPAPPVDRNRFVGRVSSALQLAQQRDGQMQLRLSPPELGSLRLEISVKQGVLTATMETETATARHILLENLPALRERLAGQEIRIERFDVDVRHEGEEQSQNRAAQERPGDQPQGRSSPPGRRTDQRVQPARGNLPLATRFNQPSPDGLDVVI